MKLFTVSFSIAVLLGVSIGIMVQPAYAEFEFCNKNERKVVVAVGYWRYFCGGWSSSSAGGCFDKSKEFFLKGWWQVPNGECRTLIIGSLKEMKHTNVYLHIHWAGGDAITDASYVTNDGFTGGSYHCVRPMEKFEITFGKNSDMSNCQNASEEHGLEKVPFLNIKNAGEWDNYTFTFN